MRRTAEWVTAVAVVLPTLMIIALVICIVAIVRYWIQGLRGK